MCPSLYNAKITDAAYYTGTTLFSMFGCKQLDFIQADTSLIKITYDLDFRLL